MIILFKNQSMQRMLNDTRKRTKKYGERTSKVMGTRLDDLDAASCLEELRMLPGHCEEKKGDLKGKFTLHLDGGKRLLFEPVHDPMPQLPDGGLDWRGITVIRILGEVDYHD